MSSEVGKVKITLPEVFYCQNDGIKVVGYFNGYFLTKAQAAQILEAVNYGFDLANETSSAIKEQSSLFDALNILTGDR
jgi:hypothetical protein